MELILSSDAFNNNDPENILISPEDISNVQMFTNMTRRKLGLEIIYPIHSNVLEIMDRALLFSNKELIELFILSNLVSDSDLYFPYLTGEPRSNEPDKARIYYFVNTVASNVPFSDISSLVNNYMPGITVSPINYIKDGSFALGIGVLGPVALYKQPSYIDKCIPIADRGLYYLTSGIIGEYRSWLQYGYVIEKVKSKYYGINPFGDLTLNVELADILDIQLNDVNSYPINSIYRRYDC